MPSASPAAPDAAGDRAPRRGSRLAMLAVLVIGIAAGAAITAGLPGQLLGGADATSNVAIPTGEDVRLNPVPNEPARSVDGSLRADAPDDAVLGFLAAEAEGDLERAYAHLSAEEQAEFFSAAGYVAAHADLLPPVLGYDLLDVSIDGDTAAVTTDVALQPSLDPIIGLVPGDAEITWTAVAEDGGWAVELTSAEVLPRYRDEAEAPGDVEDWVAARAACEDADDLEQTPLRGAAPLAAALCDASGAVRVGGVGELSDADGAAYLAAYGGEAGVWGRVVEVDAPVALRAVVAPIGDRWVVIGILDPR